MGKRLGRNEYGKYLMAKREWISENDAYNISRYGITKARYAEIHHAICELTGICGPMPSIEAINRAMEKVKA